jgi:hypothetical protein
VEAKSIADCLKSMIWENSRTLTKTSVRQQEGQRMDRGHDGRCPIFVYNWFIVLKSIKQCLRLNTIKSYIWFCSWLFDYTYLACYIYQTIHILAKSIWTPSHLNYNFCLSFVYFP